MLHIITLLNMNIFSIIQEREDPDIHIGVCI